MDRYARLFGALKEKNEVAFIPFLVIGDPSKDLFLTLVDVLVAAGADALELGFAFSDPVADGPTVQGASQRVLDYGSTINDAFHLLTAVRSKYSELPIGLLVYANILHSVPEFAQRCNDVGVDSVLVADLPIEEKSLDALLAPLQHSVYIVPPNADEFLIEAIAKASSGYVYVTSRAGVTGADRGVSDKIHRHLELLAKYHSAPPVLGFGISRPEHVRAAVEAGFKGVIVGSALVNIIDKNLENPQRMQEEAAQLVSSMKVCTTLINE